MMRRVLLIALLLLPLMAVAKKKPAAQQENVVAKGTGKVYLFGVSQLLTDSVVYVTNINEVDSIDVEKKTGFLPYRSEFSLQLKEYMEGQLHLSHQTACVFYSTSRKKLSKQFYKIKKRYLDNKDTKIVMLDDERFRFKNPLDAYLTDEKDEENNN